MFVIRPPGILTTPRRLAEAFGCKTKRGGGGNWNEDFFCYYPQMVAGSNEDYAECRQFAAANKFQQRQYIGQYFSVPASIDSGVTPWPSSLIRPLRHFKRQGFNRQDAPCTVAPGFYASEWLEIDREYRLIFVKGKLIGAFRKTPERPWKRIDPTLRMHRFCENIKAVPILNKLHLVGVDIASVSQHSSPSMVSNIKTVCLEFNLCPGLSELNARRAVEASSQAFNGNARVGARL